MTLEKIDVTLLEPRLKHPTIFKRFNELNKGEAFVIHNDHDPKPLYYQLLAEEGNTFSWEYLESGPVFWEVKIARNSDFEKEKTVGELVAEDFRKAEVFKKFKIDFCCGGKKTLAQVCKEKKLDLLQLEKELKEVNPQNHIASQNYNTWSLDFLVDYILNTHHNYVKSAIPLLLEFTHKVARVHGEQHPEVITLAEKFNLVADDLQSHLLKEETVLFPYIKELVQVQKNHSAVNEGGFGTVKNPIRMMEHEHETVGKLLGEMRELTNNYTPPASACTTYKVMFLKLNEFEEDLHQHIHLENNILFPKSIQLETELNVM